ncbi:MAG: DUF1127 domain-containing protein [Bradyrhizobium sp.]
MSILLTGTLSSPRARAAESTKPVHQSSSEKPPPTRQRGCRRWLERQDERIALREIADDAHLLNDLGLTRDEALREAAKPFWR